MGFALCRGPRTGPRAPGAKVLRLVVLLFVAASWGEAAELGGARVVRTFPADNSLLPPGAALQATFSLPVDPTTISIETFLLSPPTGGSVAYDAASRTAVFRPAGNLLPGTAYTATLTAGIRDAQGNALSQAFSWSFYGGDQPDSSPPYVVAAAPSGAGGLAARNTAIQISFSEDLDPTTVTGESVRLDGGVAGAVRYHPPTQTVTIYPDQDWTAFAVYTVTLTTALEDSAGNGLPEPFAWQFQVAAQRDTVPPRVVRASPPDGSHWSVTIGPFVTATFSEAMDATTLDGDSFFLTPGQPGEVAYSVADSTVLLWAAVPDDVLTRATLTTAVRDLAGNPLPQEFVWDFTVSPADLDVCADDPDFPGCDSGGGGGSGGAVGCFLQALRERPARCL